MNMNCFIYFLLKLTNLMICIFQQLAKNVDTKYLKKTFDKNEYTVAHCEE